MPEFLKCDIIMSLDLKCTQEIFKSETIQLATMQGGAGPFRRCPADS
jgi:hypothetical protein